MFCNLPFWVSVEIVAFNTWRWFLEANVVKTSKARTINILYWIKTKFSLEFLLFYLYCVIRDKKVFLPSHEDIVRSAQLVVIETVRIKAFGILVKGQKLALKEKKIEVIFGGNSIDAHPMFFIHVLVGIPLSCQERVLVTDNLTIKKRHHLWILIREILDL